MWFLVVISLINYGLTTSICPPPHQSFNFSLLPLISHSDQIQEVLFMGVVGPWDEKKVCKIKCINDRWVGPLCSMDSNSTRFTPMQRPCHVRGIPINTIFTYRDKEVK
ncbi:unnamed protein product, partial [Meganyctiphanes norvegica]